MFHKNRDERNRWRNKTVAFRVSPEEDKQLETFALQWKKHLLVWQPPVLVFVLQGILQ